jgi:hypothetical protein
MLLCLKYLEVRPSARLLIGWFSSPEGGKSNRSGGVEMTLPAGLAGVR